MKRKANSLLSIEVAILAGSIEFHRSGDPEFHGYAMARELRAHGDDRRLTAHGTLYRALERLEKMGFLTSRWEDAAVAASEERPRRRLYHITATGELALAEAQPAEAHAPEPLRQGLSPS